ncbi:MAG: hypothetical protein ACOCXJ_00655 [Planctomycetota bacterium]
MRCGALLLELTVGIALMVIALTGLGMLGVRQLHMQAEHLRRIQAELILDGELALLHATTGGLPAAGRFRPRVPPPTALNEMLWQRRYQEEGSGATVVVLELHDPSGALPPVRVEGLVHGQ